VQQPAHRFCYRRVLSFDIEIPNHISASFCSAGARWARMWQICDRALICDSECMREGGGGRRLASSETVSNSVQLVEPKIYVLERVMRKNYIMAPW